MKKYYWDHKTKRDEYLLNKENPESDADDEEKVDAIRNIKRGERHNKCYWNSKFHHGTGISVQEINQIQVPISWITTEEYKGDDKFQWMDSKKVNKDNEFLWRVITVPAEF